MARVALGGCLFFAAGLVAACTGQATIGGGGSQPDAATGDPGSPDAATLATELCNGLDDDHDDAIDEECSCAPAATQACWPGTPEQRGVGRCADGIQTCAGSQEFGSWGPCEGAVLPGLEIPDNGIDEDCNGTDAPSCVPDELGERCNNQTDDDCDDLADCYDPDCTDHPDCEDFCIPTDEVCSDGIDNDCDDLIDCDDVDDCSGDPWACTCIKQCPPGSMRWCDEPTYCHWGLQTCNPDGTWGACVETPLRPLGCSGPIYSTICCVLAGQCCQAFPSNDSIGNCPPGEIVCEPI